MDMTLDMTMPVTSPLSTQVSTLVSTHESPLPAQLADQVRELQVSSKAANTLRAYRSDLSSFTSWCEGQGRRSLPATPETVAAYVAAHVGVWKVSTLVRRVAAISEAHKLAQVPNPCQHPVVTETLSGLRRKNTKHRQQAAGLLAGDLKRVLVAAQGTALADYRDRALLLVGWLTRWGLPAGAMSGQAVAAVLQRRAAAAGLVGHYSGHSLRVGLIQEAKLQGVEDSTVMATTRHRGLTMLRQYQGNAGLVSKAAHRGLLA